MKVKVLELLNRADLVVSNNEARRCMFGGAVFLNGQRLNVLGNIGDMEVDVNIGDTVKIGRKSVTLAKRHIEG